MVRMPMRFRHAAIVGKYQARGIRPVLEEIAYFLVDRGLEVSFERDTASATGVTDFESLSTADMAKVCDIAVVGMAGRYPKARNIDELWKNLQAGRDCIEDLPQARYEQRLRYEIGRAHV